jgi:hypothetical protein
MPLNFESVTEGRLFAIRRLRMAATEILQAGDSAHTRRRLSYAVEENDFDVATWYAVREGQQETPFAELRRDWPTVWRRFTNWAASAPLGG